MNLKKIITMGCCGKNRSAYTPQYGYNNRFAGESNLPAAPVTVTLQYNGQSALTVSGPVSGRRYRFAGFGVQVEVDSRDVPGMRGVPHLQRVI